MNRPSDAVPSYCGVTKDKFGRVVYTTPRAYATREQAAIQCFNYRIRAARCYTRIAALRIDGRVVDTGELEIRHKRRYWQRVLKGQARDD